ncbi:MAG: GTP cyclohydrolase II RibA [Acidimicrobiales bacterium]
MPSKTDQELRCANSRLYPEIVSPFSGEPSLADFAVAQASESMGEGIIALREFPAGSILASFTGPILPHITQYSLQLSTKRHLHDPYFMGKLLHSCSPNCEVDLTTQVIRSLLPIKAGSFLSIDYEATEDRLFRIFSCRCGSRGCRRLITGRRSGLHSGGVSPGCDDYLLVSEAALPIHAGLSGRLMVWESPEGLEPLYVFEHKSTTDSPTTVRIHSACFTGDILGSLRCDCGEQLSRALHLVCQATWGLLLYVPWHEGRGIGLANKLRAYEIQSQGGSDTFDANKQLGFGEDLRDYSAPARVIAQLGVEKAVLLTRNPLKVQALTGAGVEVTAARPIDSEATDFSDQYIKRKLQWFDEIRREAASPTDRHL